MVTSGYTIILRDSNTGETFEQFFASEAVHGYGLFNSVMWMKGYTGADQLEQIFYGTYNLEV